jgi:hypothetical protein
MIAGFLAWIVIAARIGWSLEGGVLGFLAWAAACTLAGAIVQTHQIIAGALVRRKMRQMRRVYQAIAEYGGEDAANRWLRDTAIQEFSFEERLPFWGRR